MSWFPPGGGGACFGSKREGSGERALSPLDLAPVASVHANRGGLGLDLNLLVCCGFFFFLISILIVRIWGLDPGVAVVLISELPISSKRDGPVNEESAWVLTSRGERSEVIGTKILFRLPFGFLFL